MIKLKIYNKLKDLYNKLVKLCKGYVLKNNIG